MYGASRPGVSRDDLVFAGERGEYLDNSALRRRYKAALLKRAGALARYSLVI